MTIVGARPQFVKAAAVSRALLEKGLKETIIHTGQHFDAGMSDIFFDELGIPAPAHNLAVHSLGHGAMTGRMLEGIEEILRANAPDLVLVYGDTNSTLAGALAASKLHCPVAHVEAGLRSFNRRMPEEINRVMTDHLSDILFCPTRAAVDNLKREGLERETHLVGDVMYDATLDAVRRSATRENVAVRLGLAPRGYAVATIHRAENTDDPVRFARIADWLAAAAEKQPIVLPVHPRTRALLNERRPGGKRVHLIDPLGYLDMARLLSQAAGVFTDSGGLQKEAYFHRVPCVTLRDETEWIETIDAGWNRLWTVETYRERSEIADYGEGQASLAIAGILETFLGADRAA
ncbi:UDP-N-acetylglucosamine 2-epimerase (non-hydrolyzing) [Aureimonas leprariae]|uniref:UDP-N-acetylglucosamine 2-epimerase (Non-hydrolyzing) n=1 Tax=Plantimonas leprariae TaxID=2615207 RepID=A0A7V7TUM0_9HYPH|nr:UDP-N-acetylglucosamine 2-epimerase (non-hydrolyzing) [Aureimonas leprariae]